MLERYDIIGDVHGMIRTQRAMLKAGPLAGAQGGLPAHPIKRN